MPKVTRDDQLSCSQLPALMGYSPYSKPNDILRTILDARRGADVRFDAGEAAYWGNALEDRIIDEICRRLTMTEWFSPDYPYQHDTLALAASADAIASKDGEPLVVKHDPANGIYVMDGDEIVLEGEGVIESKLTRSAPESDPALYRGPIQVQGVMMCTGFKWAAIGVLYSGVELRIFLYKPHQNTIDAITEAIKEFEAKVTTFDESGDVDWYPPSDSKDANRVWPQAKDEAVDLGDDFEAAASAIVELKAKAKILQEQIERHETTVKSVMQEFSSAKAGRYSISWPMRHYKAQPEKVTPAKEAYSVRQSTLTIKEMK